MFNKENINKLIETIKLAGEHPKFPNVGFSMNFHYNDACSDALDTSGHNCGTVGCISGWAALLATGQPAICGVSDNIAADFLGFTDDDYVKLFYPDTADVMEAYAATPAQAVRALEILRDTGKVDWATAMDLDR